MSDALDALLERLQARDALLGVCGLGYVGLPVAVSFAGAGFRVLGIDSDPERVQAVEEGRSYLPDVDGDQVRELRRAGRLRGSTSYRQLSEAAAVLICLPTPLRDGAPDLSIVLEGAKEVSAILEPGSLVILESTTYPGTTEELLLPVFESGGRRVGKDFFLAYSPERIDPGNPIYGFADIPKVVGGVTERCTGVAVALYEQVVPKIVTVSAKEAELSKLIENTFRHVNIALVNELAVYAHEMGIDIWEALEAAATKPFGFLPFWPGPGWGGHCIPLDPAYLSWRVRRDRAHEIRFVELAHEVNSEMSRHVVERMSELLSDAGKPLRGARILAIGASYKAGTNDTRESPGVRVLGKLLKRGADVSYHDPLVRKVTVEGRRLESVALSPDLLRRQDLVLVLVKQEGVEWELVVREAPVIFDCCNAIGKRNEKVTRL